MQETAQENFGHGRRFCGKHPYDSGQGSEGAAWLPAELYAGTSSWSPLSSSAITASANVEDSRQGLAHWHRFGPKGPSRS